ncbi:MAG: hypothetical protein HY842_19680 [Bacteroidetes bacterium]|nr:hypothetical protein [Bacteroidota bacterium]
MKNKPSHSFILTSLAALSLVCYLYLHSVAVKETGLCPSSFAKVERVEETPAENPKVILPDVALVKKILNITKIVMPGN